jgi:hypothetical protein
MKLKQILNKLLFPLIGLGALIWFLIRVIPKPSRATYPCMRVAYPVASGFVIYLLGLAASAFAIGKVKEHWKNSRYWAMAGFLTIALVAGFFTFQADKPAVYANTFSVNTADTANVPIGVAKGIFPGRVVWVHDTAAVNQNCNISSWYLPANMNQTKVDQMLSSALHSITGQTTDSAAWVAIFKYHNNSRGKGAVNYVKGEKIFIKTNATSAYSGNYNATTLVSNNKVSETSIAPVLAVLRQLVYVVGVADSNIYIGDPLKHIYKHLYDVWHGEFPHAHYLDNSGYTNLGREKVVASTTAIIHYSDKGTILRTNSMSPGTPGVPVLQNNLYTIFETAEYVLNIPQLKGHQRAGMTMFAKNHLGSQVPGPGGNADQLHMGLVRPYGTADLNTVRGDYGMYRVQVDMMTHKLLSGKNLLYIMDALWGTDYELDFPLKWQMAPFNNTYTSSIFVSFDPVAIESVGYDFLRSEFTDANTQDVSVQMPAVDDYLHQAADSTNWPAGIKYDPNNTGVHVYSLGVHEHWDNATDKKYNRNLNPTTGTGIELIETEQTSTSVADRENSPEYFRIYSNYPNPFNPSTTIAYSLPERSSVVVKIYDIQGRQIKSYTFSAQSAGYQRVIWNGTNDWGNPISSGVYVYRVRASSLGDGKTFDRSAKMLLLK